MNNQTSSNRLIVIDQLRGIAIVLMMVFHFCYNLSVFGFLTFVMDGGFFSWFRFVIVTLFFVSVGASLYLAHTPMYRWRFFWIRELKIAASAAIITLSTFFLYPNAWVYFGVLHFIALASLFALPFIRLPHLSAVIGIGIFLAFNLTEWFNLKILYQLLQEPLNLPKGTVDLTRFIPWVGMVLIGVYFGRVRFWGASQIPLGPLHRPIMFLSRHSLIIYLVHQAPLFGLAYLLNILLN